VGERAGYSQCGLVSWRSSTSHYASHMHTPVLLLFNMMHFGFNSLFLHCKMDFIKSRCLMSCPLSYAQSNHVLLATDDATAARSVIHEHEIILLNAETVTAIWEKAHLVDQCLNTFSLRSCASGNNARQKRVSAVQTFPTVERMHSRQPCHRRLIEPS
jgi:hypothetical protein